MGRPRLPSGGIATGCVVLQLTGGTFVQDGCLPTHVSVTRTAVVGTFAMLTSPLACGLDEAAPSNEQHTQKR